MACFSRRSTRRALGTLAADWGIVITAATLAERAGHPLAWLAAAVIIAGRQTALLNLTHAAAHRALCARPRHDLALEPLYAWPIADTIARYRVPHLEHHDEIAAGHADRFSFLHEELGLPGRGPLGRSWVVFLRPLLGHAGYGFLRGTVRAAIGDRSFRRKILLFWAAVIVAAALAGALRPLALYWIVPLVWLHPVFLLWGEVSDHFQAPGGTRDHVGLFHRALTNGHALYHDVHHRYPFIPFYREREAHAYLVEQGLAAPAPSRSAIDFVRRLYEPVPL
jgi:fatty acid desaturase